MTQPNLQQNVDLQEVQKFTDLANEWWDKSGAFATLHQINPLRLNWIEQQTIARQQSGLTGKKVLDVGCGGGILSHSMAVRGATVTVVANPVKLSATPPTYRSAPPVLGEHTEAVLSGILGMSAVEIETLRAKGIL